MKNLFKAVIIVLLRILARIKLFRERPVIIGITGSMGKTSIKDAVAHMLSEKLKVKTAKGGYNTEFGVPLMILNQRSAMNSFAGWIKVLFLGFLECFKKEGYDVLVAEMGIDKPGDMDMLLKILHPNITIYNGVARIHTNPDQFSNEEAIAHEKEKIFSFQRKGDMALVNFDNEWSKKKIGALTPVTKSYGYEEGADLRIVHMNSNIDGLTFTVEDDGIRQEFTCPILGEIHGSILLPAMMLGKKFGMEDDEIQKQLSSFSLPKGRLNYIEGMKGCSIIDSSYNALSDAVMRALDTLNTVTEGRKIAVLGQMNELGEFSEEDHRKVGAYLVGKVNVLVAVFGDAHVYIEEAQKRGMPEEQCFFFETAVEAGEYLQKIIQSGDTVLVKGSQNNVRLEKCIKMIMAHPEQAKDLLVRQTEEWQD